MKKTLLIIGVLMLWQMVAIAQPCFIPDTPAKKVGQVEWKHPIDVKFTVTNSGDQPLVLTDVQPDCDCTVARWTETPIAPNATGEVNVTFDATLLGTFDKGVAVYTNAEPHVSYLRFSGQVMAQVRDYTRTHPYKYGDVRIDTTEIAFPEVEKGNHPVIRIGVANESDRPYEPVLMHLPSYVSQVAEPAMLQPYEHGEIILTLESEQLNDYGLTQASVYLSRFTGDVVGEDNELPLSVIMIPDFSYLTEETKPSAPVIDLSTQEVDFSTLLAKKAKAKHDIIVTNQGKLPLMITKVQVFNSALGVSLKKNVIEAGQSAKLRITINKNLIDRDRHHLRVLLITNDYRHPKVEINVKAR